MVALLGRLGANGGPDAMMRTKGGYPLLKKTAIVAAAAIGAAFLAAAPALASNAGTTVHLSVPLVDAGLTLTCGTTVLTATGGVFGMVNGVEHISPNGQYFAFDFGNCSD